MAKSKYEYVKKFEQDTPLLPNTWLVVRLDGRGFHKFTDTHQFSKPNDSRALNLMNESAKACMKEFTDIILSYGESDEYSFVFRKETMLFNRRTNKILSSVVSFFTANYVLNWPKFMVDSEGNSEQLIYPPQFDGRVVCYPSRKNIRDYLSWRQADTHINNMYNTCYWTLVLKGGKTPQEAQKTLEGTFSKDKNEILFSQFGINYNNEPPMFRKGSIVVRRDVLVEKRVTDQAPGTGEGPPDTASPAVVQVKRRRIVVVHEDLILDKFWAENTDIFPLEGA
eukprot:m.1402188 g.1402188  ORF g.1402188 m.1402188 type:complete len:281 (-) comp25009_c0_seq46:118-960(-)